MTVNLIGCTESEVEPGRFIAITKLGTDVYQEFYVEEIKLILRPMDSMSNEEQTVYAQLGDYDFNKTHKRNDFYLLDKMAADQVVWALRKGLDLFDLQSAGLAIYESDLEDPRDYKELDEPEPLNP